MQTHLTNKNYNSTMNLKLFTFLLFVFSFVASWGQTLSTYGSIEKKMKYIVSLYEDSLNQIVTKYTSLVPILENEKSLGSNPRYYRLFCPPTLYSSPMSEVLTMGEETLELYATYDSLQMSSLGSDNLGAEELSREYCIDNALLNMYLKHPEYICYTEENIKSDKIGASEIANELKPTAEILPSFVSSEEIVTNLTGTDLVVKKPNFWRFSGNSSLQFTQNYISGNWSEGGESTNTLISRLILEADYDDKQRIKFENEMDIHLGFTTAPSDTEHKYRTNTDVFKINSKLGVKAVNSWYYTVGMTMTTQLLRNYKANSNVLQSAIFAPLKLNLNVGMDYNRNYKNGKISVNLAPLAYQFTYVGNRDVDETRFGVKKGKRSLHEYGSQMTINNNWQIYKNISWRTKLWAFTNYEKVEASWENTFDFAVSKYLSTKLFLHGRFNDGIKRKKGYSYFQFKELLSFGLSYKW